MSLFSRPAMKRLRACFRQLIALTMVAALAACTLGIPLPIPVEKSTTEAFPCMNCPCGCKTAEKCWRDCCCHTHAEKLAWARDNGVTPPAYVLAAAQQPSCCSKKAATSSCCSSHAKTKCCGSKSACQQPKPKLTRKISSTVLVLMAQRCQGLTSSLTALPPSVMPPQITKPLATPPFRVAGLANDLLSPGPLAVPDTPPPQCFA